MNENSFEYVRLGKSKREVDVCSNTIRQYGAQGLRLYRVGRAVFFSRAELAEFIRSKANNVPGTAGRTLPQAFSA
jgi:hypothetical protein